MSRETDANQIRVDTLATLEEARAKLHAWRFLRALRTATDDDRDKAAKLMLDVALARQTLASAILHDIVEALEAQEDALKAATAGMETAVADLDRVKPVTHAIGTLVEIVGKIASFA